MDYKKKYKEALERMKSWVRGEHPECFTEAQKAAEFIFPELAMSEDERISKEIIKYLERTVPHHHRDEVLKSKEWIAWLEKQGEQKLADSCDSLIIKSKKFPAGEKRDFGYFNEPTNKIEPKFKVGDWVVNNISKDVFLIKSINNGYCTLEDIKGNIISPCLPPCESESHLWTIEDARPGDVLAEEPIDSYPFPFVAIYKKQNEEEFDSYCFIGFNGKFYEGEMGHSTENIHPATKEQCDILFKEMKNARYEWDAENLQLTKILHVKELSDGINIDKQKLAEWSEEDEKMFRSLHNLIYVVRDCDCDSEKKLELSVWFDSLKERYTWRPSDEQMNDLKKAIDSFTFETDYLQELFEDLKKLKGE